MDNSSADKSDISRVSSLRKRELEVLGWLSEGKTNWEIGRIIECTTDTVKKHVHRILRTLGVSNRTSAALIYLDWRRGNEEAA